MENNLAAVPQDDAETLVGYYEEFESNTLTARTASERNRDYYDNKQFTQEEEAELKKRGQPIITFNLVKKTINALIGLEEQNKTDPKGLPRTPKHEEDAASVTDALRYVVDNNDFDATALNGFEDILIEGTEGVEVNVEDKGETLEVIVEGVDWDRMWWDVHSRKKGFGDAKYKGIIIWMDYADAKDRWGDNPHLTASMNTNDSTDTHSDKPVHKWDDAKRKRVKIAFANYKKGGVWHWAYFTKGGIIEGGVPSPFLDEDGQPEDQLEFQSAYVDRDGNRYGYTTELLSPQDEVNKCHSKSVHLINTRQTFGNQRAGIDSVDVKNELAKPDGHVEMGSGEFGKDFGVIPTQDMLNGNVLMMGEGKEMFNTIGANSSLTGRDGAARSGRAEQVRELAGARELVPVLFSHKQLKRRVYRKVWNRIRQYWKEERWVRVTDDEKNLKWVGVNQPVRLGEQIEQEFGEIPPQFQGDPRLNEIVEVKNQLSEIDVDILIEESPDVANIQQEQFELVADLAATRPEIPIEAIVELSTLRNKEQFIEKIKGGQEARQANQQKMMEREQIAKDAELSEIEKTRSESYKNGMLAGKAQAETAQITKEILQPVEVGSSGF